MPELVFLRRGEEVLRFTLDRPRVVLGRGDRCDVVIPDPEVSRQQALLLISGDTAVVEDLSGKGTVIGGARAQRAPLSDGAEIALGQWRAIFRARSPSTDDAPETEVRGTTAQQRLDADSVRVQPLTLAAETRERIEDNLVLFYTGIRRSASEVLAVEASRFSELQAELE